MEGYRDKWWYSTGMIVVVSLFSFLILPALLAISLLIVQIKQRSDFYKKLQQNELLNMPIKEKEERLSKLTAEITDTELKIEENAKVLEDQEGFIQQLRSEFEASTVKERDELLAAIDADRNLIITEAKEEAGRLEQETSRNLASVIAKVGDYQSEIEQLSDEHGKLIKEVERYRKQARKYKADVLGLKNFNERFPHTINFDSVNDQLEEIARELDEDRLLGTVIRMHLHSDNSKELRKLSNATNKEIQQVLTQYENRYTTKGNKTIYNLMVIGLQAEVQLLLLQLKYNRLEESTQSVKDIITKYLAICATGNMSILPTITKFLNEMEPLYIELINIEYKYYVYREREKEEQRMIKEQMKQEAAERKQLAEEKKKLEKEEEKFAIEIARNKKLLEEETDNEKVLQLEERLKELETQVKEIDQKKEEITSLTLGKAGYVYVISNLGSFGDQMFKIGMTRRMSPQERVDELGSASVPFKFDVHAMIFSDDAVGLETQLHRMLNQQRVNKVNYRKEFFKTDVASLRNIVEEIDPTVEFVTTMLAEEYNQSIAMEEAELVS